MLSGVGALIVVCLVAPPPSVCVVESNGFANALTDALNSTWKVVACGDSGSGCRTPDASIRAVVGRADAVDLDALSSLELVQSASYFYTDGAAVPSQAAIAEAGGFWPTLGADQIAEWAVAAIFESQYKL